MSEAPHLRPVPSDGEITATEKETIDLWLWPEQLPPDIAVTPRLLPAERHWSFSKERVQLLPAPVVVISDLVDLYRDEPVMGYHQLKWMLENPSDLSEAWRPFRIYFLGFEFRREPWMGHIYSMHYKENVWHRQEERFDSKPIKNIGRIILMR